MKMTKLLASAAAASLAVTSLATVASAKDPAEFNMGTSVAKVDGAAAIEYLVDNSDGVFTVGQTDRTVLSIDMSDVSATIANVVTKVNVTGLSLKVEGTQATKIQDGVVQQTKNLTANYSFVDDGDKFDAVKGDGIWSLLVLEDTIKVAGAGEFASGMFYTIDKMTLTVNANVQTTNGTVAKELYGNPGFWMGMGEFESSVATAGETSELVKEAFDFGGIKYTATGNTVAYSAWVSGAYSQWLDYPSLNVTNPDYVNDRWDITVLSDTDAKTSENVTAGDNNQTKDNKIPFQFAGLASQAADYFNKQTTGTITFYLTAPTSSGSDFAWSLGGIPSTEVGFNFLTSKDITAEDMALFFNYEATTGSMVAFASIDSDNNAIVFDITEVLDDFGGLTKATLEDIYYGLRRGWSKTDAIVVEKVVFEADDAAAEAPDADDDAADLGDDDADDDDDDATLDDDADDDATADDDADDDTDADDDSNVAGDNTVTDDDDDSNPPTGVALAVIPAMVAGAAAIVAKKRK